MRPVQRICLALGIIYLAATLAVPMVQKSRADRHYFKLLYAARNGEPQEVINEYHHLPKSYRTRSDVVDRYAEASDKIEDKRVIARIPLVEQNDILFFLAFVAGLAVLVLVAPFKPRKLYSREKEKSLPDAPTDGQIAFIKRINQGIVPVGLTKDSAALMIKHHFATLSAAPKTNRLDFAPSEFMSGSRSYREKMKLERERKRAQEKLLRQQQQEQRRKEREALNAQRAADRLYAKRIAEEEKLIKARDESRDAPRKPRNEKERTIQEFQNLVNDILADKKIEPQEVRQLKAWLIANRKSPDDFAPMLKVIDESLMDGIIDEEETQSIYQGVIDCLITLRESPLATKAKMPSLSHPNHLPPS